MLPDRVGPKGRAEQNRAVEELHPDQAERPAPGPAAEPVLLFAAVTVLPAESLRGEEKRILQITA